MDTNKAKIQALEIITTKLLESKTLLLSYGYKRTDRIVLKLDALARETMNELGTLKIIVQKQNNSGSFLT